MNLDHGERYGKLTVLRKTPSGKYICVCICGTPRTKASAKQLMRGEVKECRRCSGIRSGAKRNQ